MEADLGHAGKRLGFEVFSEEAEHAEVSGMDGPSVRTKKSRGLSKTSRDVCVGRRQHRSRRGTINPCVAVLALALPVAWREPLMLLFSSGFRGILLMQRLFGF